MSGISKKGHDCILQWTISLEGKTKTLLSCRPFSPNLKLSVETTWISSTYLYESKPRNSVKITKGSDVASGKG
jgi:hypothetical protein